MANLQMCPTRPADLQDCVTDFCRTLFPNRRCALPEVGTTLGKTTSTLKQAQTSLPWKRALSVCLADNAYSKSVTIGNDCAQSRYVVGLAKLAAVLCHLNVRPCGFDTRSHGGAQCLRGSRNDQFYAYVTALRIQKLLFLVTKF